MKSTAGLLLLALAALGLLGANAYVYLAPRNAAIHPVPPPLEAPREAVPPPALQSEQRPTLDSAGKEEAAPPAPSALLWSASTSKDLFQLLASLRSMDCPEQTIRDIIIGRVEALFAERDALYRFTPPEAAKSWGSRAKLTDADLESARKWRQVQLEKRLVLKTLLGIDMPIDVLRSTHTRNYEEFASALASLPLEKRERVQALKEKYWEESDALKEKHQGGDQLAHADEYWEFNRRHEEELGRVLTPSELEEFFIRSSVTGNDLTSDLADFAPTESEFREIFRIKRESEEATGRVGGLYGMFEVDKGTKAAAHQERIDRLKAALGPERFTELERMRDGAYRDLLWLAGRHGLPREAARKAWEAQATQPDNLNEILGESAASTYRRLRSGELEAAELEP